MNAKDKRRLKEIARLFEEMDGELESIDSLGAFLREKTICKAVLFDLLQIGENLKRLSDETGSFFLKNDIIGLTSLRNYIAHDYGALDYSIVWKSLEDDVPRVRDIVLALLNASQ